MKGNSPRGKRVECIITHGFWYKQFMKAFMKILKFVDYFRLQLFLLDPIIDKGKTQKNFNVCENEVSLFGAVRLYFAVSALYAGVIFSEKWVVTFIISSMSFRPAISHRDCLLGLAPYGCL